MSWLTAVLAVGAVARLTRLVTADKITEPLRDWTLARWARLDRTKEPSGLAYLVTCPWCVSIYLSVPIALVAVFFDHNRAVLAGLLALTASLVTARLQMTEPDD